MGRRADGSYDYGDFDAANPMAQQRWANDYQRQADKANSVGRGVLKAMQDAQKPIDYTIPQRNQSFQHPQQPQSRRAIHEAAAVKAVVWCVVVLSGLLWVVKSLVH